MTQDGKKVLCRRTGTNNYILKEWSRATMPAMRKDPIDIDTLMQLYMAASRNYNMVVFKFTEEQLVDLTMKKLQGH